MTCNVFGGTLNITQPSTSNIVLLSVTMWFHCQELRKPPQRLSVARNKKSLPQFLAASGRRGSRGRIT